MSLLSTLRAPLAGALLVSATLAQAAATDINERIATLAEAQRPALLKVFKQLHAHPELGFQETETSKMIAKHLKKLGYQVHTGIGGTGIAAVLKNGDGPTVMFRSDMDALPLKEDTDLDYASNTQVTLPDGSKTYVAHACGHDSHVSWLLGIADVMKQTRDAWSGTLVLVAQPAEELIEGAQAMVDDGLYDQVPEPDMLIAAHVFPVWPSGTVAVRAGRRMAGSDALDVTLHGIGSHGSAPQNGIDPVVLGARSIMAYQTIVSRNIDPQQPAVLTVGAVAIGEANNVIPDNGTLRLNLRWYQEPVRAQMLKAIKRETNGIAQAAGVPEDRMPEYTMKGHAEPVYNDEALVEQAQPALIAALGKDKLMPGFPPVMGSEDFPLLVSGVENAKTLFVEVGGGPADVVKKYMATGELPPINHNPKFEIVDPGLAITTAIKANSALLMTFLKQ
ncbi:amidohydrolase [Alcanivorax sp. N3-2A]|nr:amidohydrolase [Alcanivorax sp. N3-2A]|tara:strand:- start:50683 stop:52026 length:1344 start_codon:yes stop_codon:yes gene_type:complete